MLQKESYVVNSDNSGVKKLKVFNVYKNGVGYKGTVNFFIYGSIKQRDISQNPKLLTRYLRKKARSCIIRTRKFTRTNDNQYLKSVDNATTLFSRRAERYNLKVYGPMFFRNRRQRYFLLTKNIV